MNSEKLFRAIGEIDDDKIVAAKDISNRFNYRLWGTIAACLVLIFTVGIFAFDYLEFQEPIEDYFHNNYPVTKEFAEYGEGEFAIGISFYLDGYQYLLARADEEKDWSFDLDSAMEMKGEYLGQIQYGEYQAYRQSASKEYMEHYGIYDKNQRIMQGVYDRNKGKTFSENKNIIGAMVYASNLEDYILVVELDGVYEYFVGYIVTETDYPFQNAFNFYRIESGDDIKKIEVFVYDWKNGHNQIDENLVSQKTVTDVSELESFYTITTKLKADRDNGQKMVQTRSAYWEEIGSKETKSVKIIIYLQTGYSIELNYRQQYHYLCAFTDAMQIDNRQVMDFHSILGID